MFDTMIGQLENRSLGYDDCLLIMESVLVIAAYMKRTDICLPLWYKILVGGIKPQSDICQLIGYLIPRKTRRQLYALMTVSGYSLLVSFGLWMGPAEHEIRWNWRFRDNVQFCRRLILVFHHRDKDKEAYKRDRRMWTNLRHEYQRSQRMKMLYGAKSPTAPLDEAYKIVQIIKKMDRKLSKRDLAHDDDDPDEREDLAPKVPAPLASEAIANLSVNANVAKAVAEEGGVEILTSLARSMNKLVAEEAAGGLWNLSVGEEHKGVMRDGGIRLLLGLAKSYREGLQSEAAKAIANLSVNANVAKAIAEEGGIEILTSLARSMNKLVAEEAAGGLWNLSVGEEHKGAIAEAGGVLALVDLIFKWSSTGDGVLERAAGALANLAADDKCSTEVALCSGATGLDDENASTD
ncbi:uncharacterized protein LOC123890738 [Trifolium pratense]|uniref:uncharacterized protein LOC123890738 n=1 Tax=Trifolium pratense TaxID=57577 RepID=UPI001E695DD6|nr:uncharacterized protein LOC123890738 [Trifolium pratense]